MKIRTIAVARINPAPYNPRIELRPGDPEYEKLRRSMEEFGYVEPLVWNSRTGHLVGGHQRFKVLRAQGARSVDVSVVNLPLDKEKALNLALNRISGDWDPKKLAELLDELVHLPGFDLSLTGFDPPEVSELLAGLDAWDPDKQEAFDVEAELAYKGPLVTKPGDLIELGGHRLLCGDCTEPSEVKRLVVSGGGKRAALFATDPPYLVDYDGTNHPGKRKKALGTRHLTMGSQGVGNRQSAIGTKRTTSGGGGNKDWSESYGVTWDDADANSDLYDRFIGTAIAEAILPNAAWYCWHASKRQAMLEEQWVKHGAFAHCQIIWVKNRPVLTRTMYAWQHEPCLMGWLKGNNDAKEKNQAVLRAVLKEAGGDGATYSVAQREAFYWYRIGWHYDVDADNDVDGSDVWFYFAYDDAWRIVGTFRSTDTNAKEVFVAHMAGANGRGGSSALDGTILRDKDTNTAWGTTMDGTREERAYYCQNWRGDVVSILKSTGGTGCEVMETVRYSSYGVPFGIPPGDIEGDGDCDNDDNMNWPGYSYDAHLDYDLDGDVDITDVNFTISNNGKTLGRGVLSHSSVGNRKGYCGYEHDGVIDTLAHVRNRVLMTELGRWSRRDPIGYVDGMGDFEYVRSNPNNAIDMLGLQSFDGWTRWQRWVDYTWRSLPPVCMDNFDGPFSCNGEGGPPQCTPVGTEVSCGQWQIDSWAYTKGPIAQECVGLGMMCQGTCHVFAEISYKETRGCLLYELCAEGGRRLISTYDDHRTRKVAHNAVGSLHAEGGLCYCTFVIGDPPIWDTVRLRRCRNQPNGPRLPVPQIPDQLPVVPVG